MIYLSLQDLAQILLHAAIEHVNEYDSWQLALKVRGCAFIQLSVNP